MARTKLTPAIIERLTPPERGQRTTHDKSFPGLAIRITANGVRSWVVFAKLRHGPLRLVTLGRWPHVDLHTARILAGDARQALANGVDVTAERRAARLAPVDTVAAVLREWLDRAQADKRSRVKTERMLAREVLPAWADRPIGSIAPREAAALIDRVVGRGTPAAARAVHVGLHAFFAWSCTHHRLDRNPLAGVPKPAIRSRDRVLKPAELAAIWAAAADPAIGAFGPAIKLLLWTAARRDEVSRLAWSEIDFDTATIELPAGRVKEAMARSIALSPPAVLLLRGQPRTPEGSFVFVGATGRPLSGWTVAKARLDAASGVTGWRVHDLRRTTATNLQRLGVKLEVIESVLGHVSGSRSGVVGTYQRHQFTVEARRALEAWAVELARIVSNVEPAPNVIPLAR